MNIINKEVYELLNKDYRWVDGKPIVSKKDIYSLIRIAYDEFSKVVDGLVEGVDPDLTTWGMKEDDICYTCLAGSVFLAATGKIPKGSPLIKGMGFLNGLRYYGPGFVYESWQYLEAAGFIIPKVERLEGVRRTIINDNETMLELLEEFLAVNWMPT